MSVGSVSFILFETGQPMASGKNSRRQGGGPTAVINQSLVGVALEARRFSQIGHIYGALHGVRGIVDENFVDLTQETSHNLELVANTPSSALGSTATSPTLRIATRFSRYCKPTRSAIFSTSAVTTPAIRCASSARKHKPPTTRCAPSTFRKPLTTTWWAVTTRPVFRPLRGCGAGLCRCQPGQRGLPGVYVGVVMGRHAGF